MEKNPFKVIELGGKNFLFNVYIEGEDEKIAFNDEKAITDHVAKNRLSQQDTQLTVEVTPEIGLKKELLYGFIIYGKPEKGFLLVSIPDDDQDQLRITAENFILELLQLDRA